MVSINPARRAFFCGGPAGLAHFMPWAVDGFEDICPRCGDCIGACPESILSVGDGGFPTVDCIRGGCTFCGECVSRCQHHALNRAISPPWRLDVSLSEACLSTKGISCRACGDACEPGAIRFQLLTRGRAEPQIDAQRCTACGCCSAICPVDAVSIGEAV